ncbi:uncharacterized protein LOC136753819 [Amia ocellicauda]|uniref:uncharacterized protein LOC136753819 n=1 Tax=Amia ocellicauda TaxID=2972642 RepID=UPI0034647C20
MVDQATSPVIAVLRLEFNSNNPAANESQIYQAFTDFLAPYTSLGIYPVNVTKITSDKPKATEYAITVYILINELNVPEGSSLNNQTFSEIQDPIDALFQEILSELLGRKQTKFPSAIFSHDNNTVQAVVVYHFQEADIQSLSALLTVVLNITGQDQDITAILSINGQPDTTTAAPTTIAAPTTMVDQATSPVIAVLRLEFNSNNPAANESQIYQAFTDFLAPYTSLGIYPVNVTKITSDKPKATEYAITVYILINELNVPEGSSLNNQTFSEIQDPIDALFQEILSELLGRKQTKFPSAIFRQVTS